MKIRTKFVSNSSSSSFFCDLCGEDYSGMDACLEEAEMFECEHSHTICIKHSVNNLEDTDYNNYEVSSNHCPICTFSKLYDTSALRYILKQIGKSKEQLLEELKSKFKNYEEYLECINEN